jgi:cysteine desulfurase/selenocysteine lyase
MPTPGVALGNRSLFPWLEPRAYLNHAAMSPPSEPVRAAVHAVVDHYARRGAGAWMAFAEQRSQLRERLAQLLGATAAEIGLVPNTSFGVLTIAMCLPWRRGDRVLLLRGEFPANVTPWLRAAELFGLDVVWHDAARFVAPDAALARLETTLRAGVRLVAVSAVQFQTGLRLPVPAIAALCHRYGAELFVDAIQAAGALPVDVAASGVDYLTAGAHKWLMGMEGAGVLFVADRCAAALQPRLSSWLSHEDGARFLFAGAGHLRYDRPVRARADFIELGISASMSFAALHAALGPILELGVAAIHAHVQTVLDPLEQGLVALGCISARASAPEARSNILSVHLPPEVELPAIWRALDEQGVACASPDGYLRFSPHWHNSVADAEIAVAAVRRALGHDAGGFAPDAR